METMSRQTEVETSLANIKYCVLIVRFAPSREVVFPSTLCTYGRVIFTEGRKDRKEQASRRLCLL